MTDFTKAKTKFVRNSIRQALWAVDRERIEDYLFLETMLQKPATSWGLAAAIRFHQIKHKHRRACVAIRQELATGRCPTAEELATLLEADRDVIALRESERALAAAEQQRIQDRHLAQDRWVAAGGRL